MTAIAADLPHVSSSRLLFFGEKVKICMNAPLIDLETFTRTSPKKSNWSCLGDCSLRVSLGRGPCTSDGWGGLSSGFSVGLADLLCLQVNLLHKLSLSR